MDEYHHVKDFLSPYKFSSWYLLQCFGHAEMCETPQETEGLQHQLSAIWILTPTFLLHSKGM